MSQPPQEQQPPQQPAEPVPVQQLSKSKRPGWLVVGLAAVVSLIVGAALGLTISNGGSVTASPAATVTATATATKTVTEPAATEGDGATDEPASAPSRELENSDFKLAVKELDKTCYGPGEGCSIEYRVTVKYVGPPPKPMGLMEIANRFRSLPLSSKPLA